MTRLACGRAVLRHLQSLGFWESRLCAIAKQLLKFRALDLGKELKGDYSLCCWDCGGLLPLLPSLSWKREFGSCPSAIGCLSPHPT